MHSFSETDQTGKWGQRLIRLRLLGFCFGLAHRNPSLHKYDGPYFSTRKICNICNGSERSVTKN